jgi:aminocarboxymuconate-semialdehyde decarboxylase
MLTRRTFCRQISSGFTGMLLMQSTTLTARRQVSIGGRRVKTIDFHAHCEFPGIREIMGGTTANGPLIIGPERLRVMDAQGIDVEVLSINPFWYDVSRDVAARLIRTQNEKLSTLCSMNPERFIGLASVALQHPDLAAEQLDEAIKKLGLRGASIGTEVGKEELSSPRLDPFWAKAQESDVPIFMHPQGMPELQSRLQGNGILTNVIANPLATTIALSHLIFEGTLDRFPKLKICAAHGGGFLASYPDRSDHGCVTFPQQCNKKINKQPTEYLKQIYVDSLVFSGEALRHLIAVCGVRQIVLGTDHPYPWTTTGVDHILGTAGLSDQDKTAILGGNAAALLKL